MPSLLVTNQILTTIFAAGNDLGTSFLILGGVVVTAFGGWMAVKRTKSGKINTSEAGKLWDESTAMRHELREQVEALQEEVKKLKLEADVWRSRVEALEATLAKLRLRMGDEK